MELKRVLLDKRETCLTYVLKRTGTKTKCKWAKDLDKYFTFIPITTDTVLQKGDIVVWNHNKRDISAPFEITAEGLIINHNVEIETHLGVIEGEAATLVSDCTRKILENAVPAIRIRRLTEVRPPDFLLQLK